MAAPGFRLLACASVAASLVCAPPAAADDGGRSEVRVDGVCTGPNDSELRVRAEDGRIRIELRVESARRYRAWTIVLLRERRIVFRGVVRAAGGGRSVELRRTITDWPGTDTVVARASTRDGQACRASATV